MQINAALKLILEFPATFKNKQKKDDLSRSAHVSEY